MERKIEDWVCELIPNIWLAFDQTLMPNEPLMGKANVWDAMIKPKAYLEDRVKELCAISKDWNDVLKNNKEGFPRYYRARITLTIENEKKQGKQ